MTSQALSPEPREIAALPNWIDEQLIESTKATWQPIYGRELTTREAVETLLSVGRLLDAIKE